MRKFLIVASLASLAGGVSTATASVVRLDMTPTQLKGYCKEKGGIYTTWDSGGTCKIGSGKSEVVVSCGDKACIMTHTMVFTSNRSTHGPVGQAPDTTLGKGGKNSAGANTSGASTLAGGGTSSNGVTTTKQAPLAGASNTNTSGTTGGGGLPPTGRPRLQQQ